MDYVLVFKFKKKLVKILCGIIFQEDLTNKIYKPLKLALV